MKKLAVIFISILSFGVSFAQNYEMKVTDYEGKVGKMKHVGISILIDLDKKPIKDAWKKELKAFGKVSTVSGAYLVESANFTAVSKSAVRVLSKVETTSKGTRVWLSVNNGTGYIKSGVTGYEGAKRFLKSFAKKMYKADIENQIADATKSLESSKKDQEKVVGTGESLTHDLKKNAEEKIRLDKALVQNKSDKELAIQKIATMEKALEVVKTKLKNLK